jgi:site-specific recombinase XerD
VRKKVIKLTAIAHEKHLVTLSRIRRVRGQPGDLYEVIFLDQHDRIVVPLTEWYRLRKEQGSKGTRETYLTCLLPFLTYLIEQKCPWNAPPEQLRSFLIAFHRDRLHCQIYPRKDQDTIEIALTRETPVRESTLRVMRAALRDFYLVLKDAGLYPFPNPLSSEVLVTLKREQMQTLANRGAPDHAGIRAETHEQSRRRPTAFIRHPKAQGWKPELRRELADVREGMHRVLDAMIDSEQVPLREKAVLELLQNTGARLHEIVLVTVGGYQNEGIAGQAKVIDKGSHECEIKTIYFAHNPKVEQALAAYIEQVRPLHDPVGRRKLTDISPNEPLFLSERKTPYSVKDFYWHWYKHYSPLRSQCPVRFSPHDIRHLFITEFLITLREACGAGTEHFDAERYLREREAFGSLVMGWRSPKTIDIYDHSRDGEHTLHILALMQHHYSERHYISGPPALAEQDSEPKASLAPISDEGAARERGVETIWMHDVETLAWIKKLQQQAKQEI